MKKILAILMVLSMLVGLVGLAGCTAKNTGTPNFEVPEGGFNTEEAVTITFEHTMGSAARAILQKAIARFQELYPNITVVESNKGGWSDIAGTISKEISAGNQPNIAYCYPDHVATYNLSKSVVTLDNLIASSLTVNRADGTTEVLGLTQEQIDDFVKVYYEEGQVYGDGLMYTMPLAKSTEVMYYNKTFFEKHNLTAPTTWEEVWEVCKKIKEIEPTCTPLAYDSADNWFITVCEQLGNDYTNVNGDHFVFDNEENRSFIEELRGYYKLGYFTTKQLYNNAYTSDLFKASGTPGASCCYMCIGSTGGASYQIANKDSDGNYDFEVGVTSVPQYNPESPKSISQGPSLCILKGSDTTDQQIMASWLFVKFLCTEVEFQREFTSAQGYVPVLKSITSDETYSKWMETGDGYANLIAKVISYAVTNRETYFTSPAFNGSTAARTQVGSLLNKCVSDRSSEDLTDEQIKQLIKEAFQDAVDECEYAVG